MSGPLKFDKEKLRVELVPPEFIMATASALTHGAVKYAPGNWKEPPGFEWSRLYGGLQRHLQAWANGQDIDPDSGNPHLDHACAMLAFLVAHSRRNLGVDARFSCGISPPRDV